MASSIIKQEMPERKKVKKKMSKAQMQLAIIKKKQCDAKALTIVEQLLEPKINHQWLLHNLKYLNKSHMEDVIEERAIIKLCGYILCSNTLTNVIGQQYHISTRKNKVYDVTRRKNFCSSRCYGACNYLLEQMLTSPLWLRDKEEIPVFKILTEKDELERSTPGDEIVVRDTNITLNSNSKNEIKDSNELPKDLSISLNKCSEFHTNDEHDTLENSLTTNEMIKINNIETSNICEKQYTNDNTINETSTSENSILSYTATEDIKELNDDISSNEDRKQKNDEEKLLKILETECDTTITKQDIDISNVNYACKIEKNKPKKYKQKSCVKDKQPSEFYNLAMHIEQKMKEWITENTICLLLGEEDIKTQLLENITQHDRYVHVCKKLSKLQLEDEKQDRADLTRNSLKPLPHLSVLQEEGKKMELKVRAFYKGDTVIETPQKIVEDTKEDSEFLPVLPLTDAHAPKALRRRIFLDKLNRILPDLLRALAGSSAPQFTYSTERSILIKALVNTFSLSATNIIFKTVEWTLVGLIIIKMLSMIDPQLKVLLSTRQASMYISMILMSYKLDSNYLNRLVMELINNTKIHDDDTTNF